MKKFGKLIFGTAVLASIAAGAYYIYKNYIKKDSTDDFDDFEDDFEDFDTDEDAEEDDTEDESRAYVPINLTDDDSTQTIDDAKADESDTLPEDEQ